MIIKPGTTPTIRISHDLDIATVQKVDFLFKQIPTQCAPELWVKTYPDDVAEVAGVFYVLLTADETARLREGKEFYIDPRVTLVGDVIPNTPVLKLRASYTLWGGCDNG